MTENITPTVGKTELEPLMPVWDVYHGYRPMAKAYYTALTTIRHILQTEEDAHECCVMIEDIIKGLFE